MTRTLLALAITTTLAISAVAQGTKLWTLDRYEEFAKGTSEGVALRSDGRLEPGPATSALYATGGSYIWSLATDSAGNAFAGLGGTASHSAVVLKVTPDGKSTKLLESKELGVQALRILDDGALLVATSPDGKVYRLGTTPEPKGRALDAGRWGDGPVQIFDPASTSEKPKYIWDAVEVGQSIFIATGAPAAVYRVDIGGSMGGHYATDPVVLFRTTDQHIRCLLATPDGTLWAGSDGSGVIYRIAALQPHATPFAIYAAPRREITALAADASGNLYAAGVGAKGPSTLPPLPVTGAVGVSITFVQPGSATAASSNTVLPEGSEIYRIAPNGAPSKLLTLRDDIVYALTVHNGSLLAATGNRGRVYRVDTAIPGRFTDLAHLEAAQAMAFAPTPDGLLVATSNSGKLFKVRDRLTSPALYTSPVFDAQGFAQWGHAETRSSASPGFDLYARSGNTESPLMGWSEWTKVAPDAPTLGVPSARYAQWRAALREGATLDAVALNYLPVNLAPVIDEIVVQPGARVTASPVPSATTVQIAFPPAPSASTVPTFQPDPNATPLTAQKDRTAVTVRWAAHDDNGDDLMFTVFYKGEREANWHLLKDKVTDRFLSFDAALLPDGGYTIKVIASDGPLHSDADTLHSEKASDLFILDTTPPVVENPHLLLDASAVRVTALAHDATSPIAHAEFSIDAGPWQYIEPSGKLSDAMIERYAFDAPLPEFYTHVKACTEAGNDQHIVAIRVYDRYENAASAKAIVEKPCASPPTKRR